MEKRFIYLILIFLSEERISYKLGYTQLCLVWEKQVKPLDIVDVNVRYVQKYMCLPVYIAGGVNMNTIN